MSLKRIARFALLFVTKYIGNFLLLELESAFGGTPETFIF
jgi:hypothetical protein